MHPPIAQISPTAMLKLQTGRRYSSSNPIPAQGRAFIEALRRDRWFRISHYRAWLKDHHTRFYREVLTLPCGYASPRHSSWVYWP